MASLPVAWLAESRERRSRRCSWTLGALGRHRGSRLRCLRECGFGWLERLLSDFGSWEDWSAVLRKWSSMGRRLRLGWDGPFSAQAGFQGPPEMTRYTVHNTLPH
jgi:hypothetical protein